MNEAVPFGELWCTEEDDWVNTLLLLLVLLSSAFLRLSLFVGEDESRVLFFGKVVSDIITVIVFVFVFVACLYQITPSCFRFEEVIFLHTVLMSTANKTLAIFSPKLFGFRV